MKNKYLLITDKNEFSQYIVEAESWQRALSKCYDYYGENHYITIADFEIIIEKKTYEDALNLFEHLIDEKIEFFGIIQQFFRNNLEKIDGVEEV